MLNDEVNSSSTEKDHYVCRIARSDLYPLPILQICLVKRQICQEDLRYSFTINHTTMKRTVLLDILLFIDNQIR